MSRLSKLVKSFVFIASVLAISLSLSYLVLAWTEPSSNPPNSNVSTPLNIGDTGQSKSGGLILNTGGAPNGLIVQNGNVGIGTPGPSQKLDVAGYVKGQSGLCIGSDCRTSWPASGGSGTVTSVGSGTGLTGGPITTSGTISLDLTSVNTWTAKQIINPAAGNGLEVTAPTDGIHANGGSTGLWGGSVSGNGVLGTSSTGAGVYGTSTNSNGIYGSTQSAGASGVYGNNTGSGNGIAGSSISGYSGSFSGGLGVYISGNLQVTGNVTASAFLYSSDKRLKKNIQILDNSLEKVLKLNGVSFNWKRNSEEGIGLIAQNVEAVYPELVKTDSASGMKSVEYGNLVAPLVEAIKEQQKMIESLQTEIKELKLEIKK